MELPLEHYRVLVEAAPTLIWRAGRDGRCDYFNETWLAFTGRSMEQELGEGWVEGVHADDVERCLRTYQDALQGRHAFEMEYRLRRRDGVYRWIFDRGAPFHDAAGDFAGFIGHCIDVHERRIADEAKATFLAMLAHELRTPLQALVLLAADATERARSGEVMPLVHAERLDRQVTRLRRLVAHASAGIEAATDRLPAVELDETDLVALAEHAVAVRSDSARGRVRVALRIEGEPRIHRVDAERIAQTFDILLDNAVKFSPEDGVVEAVLQFTRDPSSAIRFSVLDEGPGIPAADRARLGTPFFRASNAPPRSYPGLGLGVAIARAIATAHHGRLELAPREPRGTVASLILPAEVIA